MKWLGLVVVETEHRLVRPANDDFCCGLFALAGLLPLNSNPEPSLYSCTDNVVHHLRAGLARPWLVINFKSLANLD